MPLPELELAALKTEIMSAAERYAKAREQKARGLASVTHAEADIQRAWSDLFKAIDKVKE